MAHVIHAVGGHASDVCGSGLVAGSASLALRCEQVWHTVWVLESRSLAVPGKLQERCEAARLKARASSLLSISAEVLCVTANLIASSTARSGVCTTLTPEA